MKIFILFLLMFASLTSCANYAKKQAIKKGIKTAGLKSGESCKYVGFIGNNSVDEAKKKGGIKIVIYKETSGNFFKKCTTAYGK